MQHTAPVKGRLHDRQNALGSLSGRGFATARKSVPSSRHEISGLGLALALCLAALADESRGAIAIYRDSIPAPAASASPEHLAGLLEGAGLETAFLTSDDLADTARLDRARFDVIVLPYGPVFPVAAADSFRRFLRAGGKLFTTGGYAFDHLIERESEGWRAYQPPPPPRQHGAAWFCDLLAAGLRGRGALTFRGLLKSANVTGPGFAHFSVYQFAADGSLLAWRDLCQVRGTRDWEEHVYTFDVHPQAATVSLRAGLYQCRGAAGSIPCDSMTPRQAPPRSAVRGGAAPGPARPAPLVAFGRGALRLARRPGAGRLRRARSHPGLRASPNREAQHAPWTSGRRPRSRADATGPLPGRLPAGARRVLAGRSRPGPPASGPHRLGRD